MATAEAAIIGAGPYGLVAAAHLRAVGIEPMVFGEVMGFWKTMPKGMLLRSEWAAAHLTDPAQPRRLFDYENAMNQPLPQRIPMTEWARYGEWFQQGAVPCVDPRLVSWVERAQHGFSLRLDDGETVTAPRVIVATGLTGAAMKPKFAERLPRELATHTAEASDFSWLAGKNVAIIGGGQSALESAALLREVDAEVEVIARQPVIRWLSCSDVDQRAKRSLKQRVLRPPGALGPVGINWVVQIPELFRSLPEMAKPHVFARAARPASAWWLRERVHGVVYTVSETIDSIEARGDRLEIVLGSGGTRIVDHMVLGTGYCVRADGYRFLSPEIISAIGTRNGQPDLSLNFESSVPGLHFIGPGSDQSFGPLLHSVAGTEYAGKRIARTLIRAGSTRHVSSPSMTLAPLAGVSVSARTGH